MLTPSEQLRERQARNRLRKRGLTLHKSRRFGVPSVHDQGGYLITSARGHRIVAGAGYSLELAAVEAWLEDQDADAAHATPAD